MMDANSNVTLYSLNLPGRIGITFVIVANFLVISIFKLLVLRWTIKMGPLMPISVMTMLDEFEKFVSCAIMTVILLYDALTGRKVSYICIVRFTGFYGNAAMFYGGLAISVMRIIYIQGRIFVVAHIVR